MLIPDVETGVAQLGAVWSDLDARRQRVMARLNEANVDTINEESGSNVEKA